MSKLILGATSEHTQCFQEASLLFGAVHVASLTAPGPVLVQTVLGLRVHLGLAIDQRCENRNSWSLVRRTRSPSKDTFSSGLPASTGPGACAFVFFQQMLDVNGGVLCVVSRIHRSQIVLVSSLRPAAPANAQSKHYLRSDDLQRQRLPSPSHCLITYLAFCTRLL